jgi:hypothetical protein
MAVRIKNRLLATSLALAAAGILASVAAVLGVLLPHGSMAAFAGWLLAAAAAIGAIIFAFVWSWKKADDRNRRPRRPAEHFADERPRAVTSARGGCPAVLVDRWSLPAATTTSPRIQNYPLILRGALPTLGFRRLRMGHGQ